MAKKEEKTVEEKNNAVNEAIPCFTDRQINTVSERVAALAGKDYVAEENLTLTPNAKGLANGLKEVTVKVVRPIASFASLVAFLMENNANATDETVAEEMVCKAYIEGNTNAAYLRAAANTKGIKTAIPCGGEFQKTASGESTASLMSEIERLKAELEALRNG